MKFATRAVHAGLEPDPSYGSVIPAIHQTSTFAQPAVGEFVEDFDYARSANPTRAALETALGELEGGLASSFSSGMAATHALISAVCSAGDHVVLPNDLYGGTYRLVDKVLTRFGLTYTLVDQTEPGALLAAVTPQTRLVWVESPTNPLLNVVDLRAAIAAVGGRVFVAVDNTFATPVNQRPLELGADAVVHSVTKYLGGHSDTVGGAVVVKDPAVHEQVRFVQNSVGAVPGPFDCFLVHRGLRTLHLRMAAHAASAEAVVGFLKSAPGVVGGPLAGLLRHGVLPPSGRDRHRAAHEALHAGRVARRRRVADRGAAGDDPPVRRGLRRGRARGPRAAVLRRRGARGPRGRPAPRDRRGSLSGA